MLRWYEKFLIGCGVVTLAGILFLVGSYQYHLWQDHQGYHQQEQAQAQMIELLRQAVLEKHPELAVEENTDDQ